MNNLKGKNLCNPHAFMRHKRTPTNSVTHPGIMALKEGFVWVGCPDAECKKSVAIKKCREHEYTVQNQLSKNFDFIPKVFETVKCFDGFYMYYEYMPDGSLKKTKKNLDILVYKVLVELKKIHDKFPSFRHNDIHIDNVLVKGDTPYLFDFELSNWHGNPIFDRVYKEDYGIFTGNNAMYDFHFFINSCSVDLPKKFRDKALTVFPKEYITGNSSVVKNFRLRCDVDHKNLPTMDEVIKAFYVPNVKMARTKKVIFLGSSSNKKKAPALERAKPVKVMTFTGNVTKKTVSKRSPPKPSGVKFSSRNKNRVAVIKSQLISKGMNNVQAELKAIRNVETLKLAGLLTPSPSPRRVSPRRVSPRRVSPRRVLPRRNIGIGAGPSRPTPVLLFTETPRKRPKINKKLCSSYKKDELLGLMRRLGHRVTKNMSIKELCGKMKPATRAESIITSSVYKRPVSNAILNARKKTYPKFLRKNIYQLGKAVGAGVMAKNKKDEIVRKLYSKLNKNIKTVMSTSNKKTITARKIAEKLAQNHGWKNNRSVERLRILQIYKNLTK